MSKLLLLKAALLLLIPVILAQENVDGYNNFGRGSCIDSRGQFYSYIQSTKTFPDASTCGNGECAKFGNAQSYRGFEFSVTKRCACLFDSEKLPPVSINTTEPQYVSKIYSGVDVVTGVSGTPGATCYQFAKNSGNTLAKSPLYLTTMASILIFYLSFHL